MKNSARQLSIIVLICFFTSYAFAQVGINTDDPANGAMLDVTSDNKGIVVPRLDIEDLSTIAPVTGGQTAGLLAYNINSTTGPGFVYWQGNQWNPIEDTNLATKNLTQTAALRRYNMNGNKLNIRNGELGIEQANPQTNLHVGGTGNTVRIDALNNTNTNNNGIDNSVVMVNSDGDLVLQNRVNELAVNASSDDTTNGFLSTFDILQSPSGALTQKIIYTRDITLTRETLIEIVFHTSSSIGRFDLGAIDDGKARGYGVQVLVTSAATPTVSTQVAYDANSYTSSDNDSAVISGFALSGNGYILLPAGTHTIDVNAFAQGGGSSSFGAQGYTVLFGDTVSSSFQVIHHN